MGNEYKFTPSISPIPPEPSNSSIPFVVSIPERPKIPSNIGELDQAILNVGLSLSLEFGPNWLRPIQHRLKAKIPTLEADQLNLYDSACRGVRDHCQDNVYNFLERVGTKHAKIEDWKQWVKTTYPWINEANISHLYSQGCYYAMKDGVP